MRDSPMANGTSGTGSVFEMLPWIIKCIRDDELRINADGSHIKSRATSLSRERLVSQYHCAHQDPD
jgi:hypothetical protein